MSAARRYIKYILLFCGTVVIVSVTLLLIAIGRTLRVQEINLELGPYSGMNVELQNDQFQKFLKIFEGALKFKTVSTAPGHYDREELYGLQLLLKKSFPLVFASSHIEVETVNNYSLLLSVKGCELDLQPYLLISHLDVVSVDPEQWDRDPFLGEIVPDPITEEDVIWGRGALDDKIGVLSILSAVELLLQHKWRPKRSFYIGFGHDEEVSGADGAGHISEILRKKNVSLDFLLDEGTPILEGIIKGVETPIASIGVAEKGRMNVEVTVEVAGGHSSFPPEVQATGVLAAALQRIYANPHPSMFGLGPEIDMFKYLASKASWPYKMLFANTWLFSPILGYVMSRKRETNAVIRTTTATTMIRAGKQDNVVPATAWALINHRVHPAQTLEEVLEYDIATIGDENVKVKMTSGAKPHPISPYGPNCLPFKLIAGAVRHAFPEAVPIPGFMIANTDTQHYLNLTSAVYRFVPVVLNHDSLASIHGKNERLSVKNFKGAILFYSRLIQLAEDSSSHKKLLSLREAGEL